MTSQVKELSDAIVCKGISARTTNNAEISHDTAKLGRLWQKFYQNHMKSLSKGEDIYGVFHNYESDDLVGAFDVVASWKADGDDTTNASDVVTVNIPAGKYLVFSEKGNMPNTVMNAWEKAWEYFNNPSFEHTRTYKVDFEHYIGGNLEYGQVDLYIGIE
ncbi:GyrI-like domain-containing protein [Psychrobacter sp. Sarcosine-3u-12]|uniref:GyrI-like domain-containing protein n=1 Tax=Psychrobacter sp. Sarcosine-3u-12 TaxID=2058325 RepID=UPI000C34DE16|nr:GyrI-like domain-containing protein [Psychrobacter sp. Sarcosine-3u-12]PKG34701.1 AraC family transcriptional regulator [Psychrobacter sp. Sarcosine-3u-12]